MQSRHASRTITLTMRRPAALLFIAIAVIACAIALHLQHRNNARTAALVQSAQPASNALPKQILWVWERPEDLRSIDPATYAAAVYLGTLHLDQYVTFTPRANPYILPQGIQQIAVVRIESTPAFLTTTRDSANIQRSIDRIAALANQPGIAALQIDFDAKKKERPFYLHFLQRLREALPATVPLTITALVSWCDEDDWLNTLPINSATPMFFRMEPGRARFARTQRLSAQLPEPLCNTSVGVSTHEPWPANIANRRIYIFPDKGWKQDLPLLPTLTTHNASQASTNAQAPTVKSSS